MSTNIMGDHCHLGVPKYGNPSKNVALTLKGRVPEAKALGLHVLGQIKRYSGASEVCPWHIN